jgi:phage shock protein PspC (stress-responsive transcriptional regulator)
VLRVSVKHVLSLSMLTNVCTCMRWLWVHYLGTGMALYRLCWMVAAMVACSPENVWLSTAIILYLLLSIVLTEKDKIMK